MATQAPTRLNGVDVDQLVETIEHIEQEPDLARFEFRARSTWLGGARSRTEIQEFYGAGEEDTSREGAYVMEGDEPPVLLGTNQSPNAVETVLHALASCLAVGFAYNASAQGIEVEKLEFDLEGELDLHGFLGLSEDVRPGYNNIQVTYRVEADAPREKIEELCQYVQDTSPVVDILTNPVPISVQLAS